MIDEDLKIIEEKILRGERLNFEDGLALFNCKNLAQIGMLADFVRKKICGDNVFYNVNCHVNLTNICMARCKFCAFGRDENSVGAYEMKIDEIISLVEDAMNTKNFGGLHIVSGLHPTWKFEHYLEILSTIHKKFPTLYIKGFTGVEITHFAKISNRSVEDILLQLKSAGLQAIAGGGAEILSDRVRNLLCPKKATADEWLNVARTAHKLGLKTNASMLYGHIETIEERIQHLIKLRELQDETHGFQTFIPFPFLPKNTALENKISQTSMWDDLRTIAISRLMLDNFKHIKAYWVMLGVPAAQIALNFGANDIDGTIHKENILHEAGAKSPKFLTENQIINLIREVGRIPTLCDCNYNVL